MLTTLPLVLKLQQAAVLMDGKRSLESSSPPAVLLPVLLVLKLQQAAAMLDGRCSLQSSFPPAVRSHPQAALTGCDDCLILSQALQGCSLA